MAHQAYTRPMLGTSKYRFRTWLRGHAPDVIAQRIPKGSRACGAHEWHRHDEATDACYHCEIGVRPHEPIDTPVDPKLRAQLRDAATQGSEAAAAALDRLADNDRELGRAVPEPAPRARV